jgi:hypothetical protein
MEVRLFGDRKTLLQSKDNGSRPGAECALVRQKYVCGAVRKLAKRPTHEVKEG